MNIRIPAGALCAALITVSPHVLRAQSDASSGPDAAYERPGKPPGKMYGKPGGPMMAALTPEEAERLAAAREKAQDDPTVRSLREARDALDAQLEKAVGAAILAADPGLAPTLKKVQQSRDRAKGMRERFRSLTPEQREQLKAARRAAKDDPAVVAAREKMKSADSPEARREAGRAMHEAMKAAMLKPVPDRGPLPEQPGPPPGGGGGGGRPGAAGSLE